MSGLALGLVLLAAALHASWNLFTKRGTDKLLFLWWTGVVGSVVLLPLVAFFSPWPSWSPALVGRFVLGAVLRAAYFLALGATYTRGDLSLVYPLARGVAPIVVPVAAFAFLGERITTTGAVGISAVALGVYVMHVPQLHWRGVLAPFSLLNSSAVGYAALTGSLTASYSIADKWTIGSGAPPGWYAYLTIPVAALLLTPIALRRRDPISEWRANRVPILVVSVLMTASYLLILYALRLAPVSYVAPAREISIVFGALLGIFVLHEPNREQRFGGAVLIVAGVVLMSQLRL